MEIGKGAVIAKEGIEEHLLARIWKRQLLDVPAEGSEGVHVIYPGRENRDSGPDFLDAVLADRGRIIIGDVEIHLRASDWRGHGHNCDPKYNGVVLQVVWEGESPAELQSGKTAPTLGLRCRLRRSPGELRQLAFDEIKPADRCRDVLRVLGPVELGLLLDEMGEERFCQKADGFACRMKDESPSQVLYRGIMGALGYSRNRGRFEELAERLPWAALEGASGPKRIRSLESLLLKAAGLLPRSVGEDFKPADWEFFRVRPVNHPARRLRGAARLFARFVEEGLVESVIRLARECGNPERLEAAFTVGAERDNDGEERAFIGRGRVREILINVVLPFACAWAEANSQPSLSEQSLTLYRNCAPSGDNAITRRLTGIIFGCNAFSIVNTARRQQGLIHLDKNYCVQGWCRVCPIGKMVSSASCQPSAISSQSGAFADR